MNKDKRKINFVATAFIIVCAGSYGTTERRAGAHRHEHKNEEVTVAKEANWLYEKFGDGEYKNILGLCKTAYTTDVTKDNDKAENENKISIEEKGWSLTSGAYVGVAPVEDDGVDFEERMAEIHRELLSLQAESDELMKTISKNMKEMGL